MSVASGTFVPIRGALGEPSSGFEGPGSIRFAGGRLVFVGTRHRRPLVRGLAFASAIVVAIAALFVVFFTHVHLDGPAFPALFIVILGFAVFLGMRRALAAVVPMVHVELTTDVASIARVSAFGDRLELLTSSAEIAGITALRTPDAGRIASEIELVRKGLRGYRG